MRLQGHAAKVRVVAVSPDNKCVVSGSEDKTVRIWEVSTGVLLHTLEVRALISTTTVHRAWCAVWLSGCAFIHACRCLLMHLPSPHLSLIHI